MTDIVERIKDAENATHAIFNYIFQDAREEIERLRIENEALRAEVIHIKEVEFPRKAQAVADGWRGKCERLEAKVAEMEIGKREISEAHNVAKRRLSALAGENIALRAKIVEMERQEPVAFALYSGWSCKAVYLSEIEACEQRDRRQLTADLGGSLEAYRVGPLYALPGAKGEEK